tara:strand:- start:408 stop:1583 length:1176 start_codon:yes stop_codon:yes gene_type:complete
MKYLDKHVLILISGSEVVTNLAPTGGIFQLNQAKILSTIYKKVGLLSSGFLAFPNEFRNSKHKKEEFQKRLTIFRDYKKLYVPKKLFPVKLLSKLYIKIALNQFEWYISNHGKPDIIHAHNIIYSGLVAQKIKEKYNIPYVITEHSSIYMRGHHKKYLSLINKEVVFNFNLFAVSDKSSEVLKKTFDLSYVDVINNVLSSTFLEPSKFKKNKETFKFINIGNLTNNKNQKLIINSFLKAFKPSDKVMLILVGKGPKKKKLDELVQRSGRTHQFEFYNYLKQDEIKGLLLSCDCFVLSSNFETFGVVIIEAMACGLPVISTKCFGPEDILNQNQWGVLVDKNNIEQMVKALRDSKSEKQQVREQISYYARDKYGHDSFIKKIASVYNTFWDE